jgi:cobalt-zinc-cadmium resistance protein CzcA
MVAKLIAWALDSPVVVLLLVSALIVVGGYAFTHVNVEAYPDPAPAIIEIVAQYPGRSAEEIERQVTIPLEVALAGMPGLKYTRAKSMFGLAHIRNQFEYGIEYEAAKQQVINRLQGIELPDGVVPQISPASPIGEIMRYTLSNPRDADGHPIYTLNDLKSLQDWTLQREFRRVPRVAGVVSSGGEVKRYEVRPDPDRLKEYGITLDQLQDAVAKSNANVGGDYIVHGASIQVVRVIGLIGGGEDPMQTAMQMPTPAKAAEYLRAEEASRIQEIRSIVIASTNNVPIRVEHVVDGGPLRPGDPPAERGVIVNHHTRQGQLAIRRPVEKDQSEKDDLVDEGIAKEWEDAPDEVQGIILLRKGEQSIPALADVKAKIEELNETPGRLLPGVKIRVFYDRARLIDMTTETVHENLAVGLTLVTVILLMFLSNIRSALIVAINIPLALLFAFCVLYLRGKSANLLSIGAVDFGIIVDSSVIMVENIYRRLRAGENANLPLKNRILLASREVERSLFFSTIIMVCAMLPLFTMKGPEGQIFGPMADTYAFALGGALLLALTLSPVLCMLFFKHLKPSGDNFLVRWIRAGYLRQLKWALGHRYLVAGFFAVLVFGTVAVMPFMGREFMPELEEGNMIVRGTFPVNVSLEEAVKKSAIARRIMTSFPEVRLATSQIGRPDDGTDPTGYFNAECFVPLLPPDEWPVIPELGRKRTKEELIHDMNQELSEKLVGINWDFSQMIRDNVLESLSGVKGENSVKIIGPDLEKLEDLAEQFSSVLSSVPGVVDPGIFHIRGQSNLAFRVDRDKCKLWNVSVDEIEDVVETAVGGKCFSQMIEGERSFDITLRWPKDLRRNEEEILDIPVDVIKNTITGPLASTQSTPISGGSTVLSSTGTSLSMPSVTGSTYNSTADTMSLVPRRRLRDLVTPQDEHGNPDPHGKFLRPGASIISREEGKRLIAVKFSVRGRDLASTVAEAQAKTAAMLKPPYKAVWSGEFQQMQEAEHRMVIVVVLSLVLIMVILYVAFKSLLDAMVVLVNVVAMSLGGIWTLFATGLHFNISAAVGFISILGVAVMNGLLMVSAFNQMRHNGEPLIDALMKGTERRIRPVTITASSAILGLLPAAFSTRIGAQSQRPLAIVVVGGMLMTLFFVNLVPVLYSFYGARDPVEGSGHLAE